MIHNFQTLSTELGRKDRQLADFVDASNKNFEAFAAQEGNLREAVQLFPATLSQTATTLTDVNALAVKLGPTLEGLRPFARNLAPFPASPASVPARHHAHHPRPDPALRPRRSAHGARPAHRDASPRTGDAGADALVQGAEQLLQHAGL